MQKSRVKTLVKTGAETLNIPVRSALLWRAGAVLLIVLAVLVGQPAVYAITYTLHSQTAGGLHFDIRLERSGKGEPCLLFKSDSPPKGVREFLCPGGG